MTLDMTRGSPPRLMLRFALPLFFSSLLQQLYGTFDSVIVGRLLGAEAFAAVGSCANLNWFPLSMLMGLAQGFGVMLGQRFGAGDQSGFRRALTSSVLLSGGAGLLMSVVGACFYAPFLTLMKTPAALMPDACAYLRLIWLGLWVTAGYNVLGASLNALGDSRTPLGALVLSTLLNIALDFLFLAVFRMGVEGAALATLVSQLAALVFCVLRLRRVPFACPERADWRPRGRTVRALLRLGLPLMLTRGVTASGELAVQGAINVQGVAFVTGMTAMRRYFSLLNIFGYALEGALATFVAQNAGAKQAQRVTNGVKAAVRLAALSSAVIAALVYLFAEPLILLFLSGGNAEAVRVGVSALRVEACFLLPLNLLCLYRAAIQGVGNATIPMLSGFMELILRLAAAFALPALFGRAGLYYTDALTWALTAAMLAASYYLLIRPKLKQGLLLPR